MRSLKSTTTLIVSMALLQASPSIWAATSPTALDLPQVESVSARALDEKGNLLYTEETSQTLKNGQLQNSKSEYFNTEGKKIGELSSDFKVNPFLADYKYSDHRLDSLSGISLQSKTAELFIKKDRSKKEPEKKQMEVKGEMLSIPGVENFVRNFVENKLKNDPKEKASIRFVIPDRLDDVGFRLYSENGNSENIVQLKLEPESFFIRMFAPSIKIEYDRTLKHIVSYKGPSHVFDDNGKCQKVTLVFQYSKSGHTEVAKTP